VTMEDEAKISPAMVGELFQAAQSGDAARIKHLLDLDAALANTENLDGLTPLGYAAHFGHPDAVQMLLDYGADIDAVSHSNIPHIPANTALHAAIAGKRNIEVIRLLLARGARTDLLDSNGHTCLHTAAFHDDNVEIIRLLVEHGARVEAKAEDGTTALDLAVARGNRKVAELLRQLGARA